MTGHGAGARLTRALLIVSITVVGCGATAPEIVRNSVTAADEIQVAGMKEFLSFDLQHQTAILDAQGTVDEKRAELDAYRSARGKVVAAFSALAAASHGARVTIDAYQAGSVQNVAWGELVADLVRVAQQLRDAAEALGVKVPGLDALLGARPAQPGGAS